MNPLSKAFVILVTLLTVALSCFSIAVVGAQENYKKNLAAKTNEAANLQAQLATAKATIAERETELGTKVRDAEQGRALVENQLALIESQAKTSQFELNRAKADLETSNAALKIATINLDRTAQEREAYAQQAMNTMKQAQESGKAAVDANMRVAELSDKLRRTEIDLLRFKEQSVAAAKQAEESAKRVSVLEAQVGDQKLPASTTVAATQTINGAVTSIGKASNGVTLVAVNVGEKDQVAEGMEFTISRGANYVGTMVVTSVNTEAAVGRLTNVRGAVAQGDSVYVRGYNR